MLSYEIYNYYSFIEDKLEEIHQIFNTLFDWEKEFNNKCEEILNKILNSRIIPTANGTNYAVNGNEITKEFNDIMEELQSNFTIVTATIKYGKIKNEIEVYKSNYNIVDNYMKDFLNYTDSMLEKYQNWIQNPKDKEYAIKLGKIITEYENMFLVCQEMYTNYLSLYTDKEVNDIDKERTMEIQLLDVEFNLEEFNSILKSINEVYCELGNIMYSEIGEIHYEKLRIIKIESGSMWSILFGDKDILSAVSKLLNQTIDLVFNKFTIEGRLARQDKINSSIKDTLKIAETLEELGYEVDESKENIQKAFICSTKDLVNIASKSAKIKVNDDEHELKEELKTKYIDESKKLLLNDGVNADNNKIKTKK